MPIQATELSFVDANAAAAAATQIRRRIPQRAGKALEILAHALEYLTDEYVDSDAAGTVLEGRLEAIELLMALNRRIYLDCPEKPTPRARCRAFLRRCFS